MVAFSVLLPVRLIDYGLRDYGTAKWEGGDPNCDHKYSTARNDGGRVNTSGFHGSAKEDSDKGDMNYRGVCPKCGAIRIDEQIGLEVTPDEYIANLVDVFRECKRILRDDGTLWVNIGDSYANSPAGNKTPSGFSQTGGKREGKLSEYNTQVKGWGDAKQKDLIGIPWMLAFALRADGWYLRQDIIWAKPNPMPESVKDRCTKSHEYIFLLSKSAKYYYDSEAIMELATGFDGRKDTKYKGGPKDMAGGAHERWQYKNLQPDGQQPNTMHLNRLEGNEYMSPVRNKRDVWTVTTKPYKGAHYATFNPELIKPCILAGAPETCCAKCGAPYERIVEKTGTNASNEKGIAEMIAKGVPRTTANLYVTKERGNSITTGYRPTCSCNAGTSSGIVFDPFVGSGTTVATAIQLGRKGIGIDLSFKYLQENAKARVESAELPLLNFIEQ